MPTPKLTPQKLEEIERQSRFLVNGRIFSDNYTFDPYDSLANNVKKYVSIGGENSQRERNNEVKRDVIKRFFEPIFKNKLTSCIDILNPYFEGNRPDASHRAKTLFRNFQYYNDLMLGAFDHFAAHLERSNNFFSADIYKQWVSAMKLGLYTACDFCVLGRSGLNYPDNASPSPRLKAVDNYYSVVCVMREILATIEQEIGRWGRGGDSYSFVDSDWTDYLKNCREQLNRNFGSERGKKLFNDIFGGPDPTKPDNAANLDNI